MKKILTLLVALLTIVGMQPARGEEALKREMRTVWVATVSNIDWPRTRGSSASVIATQKKQLTDLLDGFVKANMNAICLQVRPMADALYRSSYEPWSSYLTGTRGKDPGWDPMEFAVEECHKRGLEFHAWVNPYRFSNSSGNDCNTAIDQQIKASGILMHGAETSRLVFNPALQASRDLLLNVCREMIENYDIDGIIFDDYFYPGGGMPSGSAAEDYQLWQQTGNGMSIGDWRRENVNEMVRQMCEMVQETRPGVKFGIGPAGVAGTAATSASKHGVTPCPTGSDWQYNQIYSDPLAWLEEGTIDYISPQLYWKCNHSTNPFGPLTQWWSYIAQHFNRHHYASHNIYFMADTNTEEDWAEIVQQINYSRLYNLDGAPGVNFYSAKYIDGPTCAGLADYLKQTVFTKPAIPPAMTWKTRKVYNPVSNAAMNGTALTWTGVNERAQIKYAVYAIPNTASLEEIQSTVTDGIKSDYLLGLTYNTTYTIPTAYRDGYWYAITVIDGWNYENAPAYVNAPVGDADQVTLLSPVGTTVRSWTPSFRWTAAENATYTLQVASDADFLDVLIHRTNISTNEVMVNLNALASSTTYYWRVITSQNGRFDKASESATFTTAQRPYAPSATLLSPANGASIDNDFALEYSISAEVTGSTLQVASDAAFASIKLESTNAVERNGHLAVDIQPGLLGKGTFYWRVLTEADGCDPGISEVRSFTITSLPTGAYEPGYVVKRDIDTYPNIDGLKLTNRWVRSIKEDYDNIVFDGDGLMNRGITAMGDRVLMIGRSAGASDADVYIAHFDAATGERIKTVPVDDQVQALYYPGNDIFLDDAGHAVISNLVLQISSQPIQIFQVDPDTGAATLRASLTASGTSTNRIDHCNVLGDVSSSKFWVMAAMSSGTQIIRWTVENGNVTDTKIVNVKARYPSSASNFGLAPRIYPVSETKAWVSGGSTHLTLYNLNTGNIIDSFSYNEDIEPEGTESNGAAFFEMGDNNYLLYSYTDFRSSVGHRFALAVNRDGDTALEGFNPLWVFPERGMGDFNSQTWDAPCVTTPGATSLERNLYVYVPGNGLAAYTLALPLDGDVNLDGSVDVEDVNIVINIILEQDTDFDHFARADLDDNGVVDISDLNMLINTILAQ